MRVSQVSEIESYVEVDNDEAERNNEETAIDLDEVRRFLLALDARTHFHFQFYRELPNGKREGYWTYGAFEQLQQKLVSANLLGYDVFVTVNECKGGRCANNVVRICAVFVDLDGAPLQPVFDCALKPHIIVESSPERYHCYWLVENFPLELFKATQQSIVRRFQGDKQCVDLCRVLRLPGFLHKKKIPFMTKVLQLNSHPRFSADQIIDEFKPIQLRDVDIPDRAKNTHNPKRLRDCKAALENLPNAVSGQGGHNATFRAACEIRRWGLDDHDADNAMRFYNEKKCLPKWTKRELKHKLKDALHEVTKTGEFGIRVRKPISLEPLRLAEVFLEQIFQHEGMTTLRRYQDGWYFFQESRYELLTSEQLEAQVYCFLDNVQKDLRTQGGQERQKNQKPSLLAKRSTVAEVTAALPSRGLIVSQDEPVWLAPHAWESDAAEILVCKNGLLNLSTREFLAPTPNFFSLGGSNIHYNSNAGKPRQWLEFLRKLFDDDKESIQLLQEWFAYCLTAHTKYQKFLMLLGPKRAGKGTIIKVQRELIGIRNYAGPTAASIVTPFGLQALLGKRLAVFADLRLSKRVDASILVERILSITGEDVVAVDRKFKEPIHPKLNTRIAIVSNELPHWPDSSNALASRTLMLRLTKSFSGAEDPDLFQKLASELSSILNWSIERWPELKKRGKFVQPKSGEEMLRALGELGSPVQDFVDDCCSIGSSLTVNCDELYEMYRKWCVGQGIERIPDKSIFGRDLHAVVPALKKTRPRPHRLRHYLGIAIRQ